MAQSVKIQKIREQIEDLLVEEKYYDAYRICQQLTNKYPAEKTFSKLFIKVKEKIGEYNRKVIDSKIFESKKLEKENKYSAILQLLSPMFKIAPNNEKLKSYYTKIQKKYKEQIKEEKEAFIRKQQENFDVLLKSNDEELLDRLFQLEKENPGNKIVLALTNLYRQKIINQRIEKNKKLLNSEKYQVIANIIDGLKKIDKHNKKVLALEEEIKRRQHGAQVEEKEEYIYKGEQHLDTLLKLKKYDKAIQVCKEILNSDKENKEVIRILKKSQRKLFLQTREEAIKSIQESKQNLQTEYKNNKQNFIKL